MPLKPNIIVNPFDFVTVEHSCGTKTIGIVHYSQASALTEDESSGYNVKLQGNYEISDSDETKGHMLKSIIVVQASVLTSISQAEGSSRSFGKVISSVPVGVGMDVRFATE